MKKEIIALAALVLLFTGAQVNTHFLNKLTGEISALVEEAGELSSEGKWESAREKAEKAYEKWDKSDAYTHMVLRHSEIESAGDTLSDLLKEIYAENTGATKGAVKAAAARMRSIASIEQLKLGSIF